MHYSRFRLHGDPHQTKLPRGIGATKEERFWSRVNKTPGLGPHGDCWEWMGSPGNHGYGSVYWEGKERRVHRVMWRLVKGQWPQMDILHSCDHRLCCNPSHLREGTKQDNTRDMVIRERQARGERAGNATLTEDVIRAIRAEPKKWGFQTKLAKRFGINTATVSRIRRGLSWKHI